MSRILFTWELGAGLGHLANIVPVANRLMEMGHEVHLALRDLSRIHSMLPHGRAHLWQAPNKSTRMSVELPPRTFGDILYNCGFGDLPELSGLTEAWRNLLTTIRPDVIVCDHSPSALLASYAHPMRRVLLGTGFFCPLDGTPMQNLRPWNKCAPEELLIGESRALANANMLLKQWGAQPLDRLSQLYAQSDDNLLVTFAELDHYGARPGATYYGGGTRVSGGAPVAWPDKPGKRVFAYLKDFTTIGSVLELLADLRLPTVVVCDGINPQVQRRYAGSTVKCSNQRFNIEQAAKECDLAILNGNHGTTIAMLMRGKPGLHLPLHLEQTLFSQAVQRMGAGLMASPRKVGEIAFRLAELLNMPRFTEAAQMFAQRYRDFDEKQQVIRLAARIASAV